MLCLAVCAALAAALFPPRAAAAEEPAARAERFSGLIESLNASSAGRARVLESIYNELRGPDSREMHDFLRGSLSRGNILILHGVAEAMAMLGDAADVENLDALLATSDTLEIKTTVLRLLPTFCLPSERARFNYIQYAAGYQRVAPPGVLEPLRRPPLTRRGRLDPELERLRGRVTRAVVTQFDPVAGALRYLEDSRFGEAARRAVAHFVGRGLGGEPALWARIWAAQSGEMEFRVPDEIEEIRLSALLSLSDMGAEGLPEVIDAFRRLIEGGGEIIPQAVFETAAVMCRAAYAEHPALASMQFGAADQVEAENWRLRRYASAVRLAAFVTEAAVASLAVNAESAVFDAATHALGSALSCPDGYPDAEGMIGRAKEAGLSSLERLLLLPDLSRERRGAVALALGEIGTPRAVSALESIMDSPYCSPEFGAGGQRMTEAVLDALRDIAVGGHSGAAGARNALLRLLSDTRSFPSPRPGVPPTAAGYMVLWRLQRLARSDSQSLEASAWRTRLGW